MSHKHPVPYHEVIKWMAANHPDLAMTFATGLPPNEMEVLVMAFNAGRWFEREHPGGDITGINPYYVELPETP